MFLKWSHFVVLTGLELVVILTLFASAEITGVCHYTGVVLVYRIHVLLKRVLGGVVYTE